MIPRKEALSLDMGNLAKEMRRGGWCGGKKARDRKVTDSTKSFMFQEQKNNQWCQILLRRQDENHLGHQKAGSDLEKSSLVGYGRSNRRERDEE